MGDTVAASVIAASLGNTGPSFVLDLQPAAPAEDALGTAHVSGAAHQPELFGGAGASLLVEFVSWPAAAAPVEAPPTVPGFAGGVTLEQGAPGIPGALNVGFHHFP